MWFKSLLQIINKKSSTMYGRHHKTGKDIRLLQHNTSTWRSKKTLVWLDEDVDTSILWNRVDVGVIGATRYSAITKKGVKVDVVVCIEPEDIQWIYDGGFNKVKIMFASKKILDVIGIKFFEENKIRNILCLDELHLIYPFLETPWDTTRNDACILVALVLRFKESFPLDTTNVRKLYGLKLSITITPPQKLYFITQYYKAPNSKRQREIDDCLRRNSENEYIDHIILLNETEFKLKVNSDKISQVVIGKRLFYDDILRHIQKEIPKDSIVVFANADIYLDETARLLWSTTLEDKFLALLRYEPDGKIFGPRPDSQDTWVVNSTSIINRVFKFEDFHFSFGVSGCDNAITCEMLRNKFLVANPSLSIITHHKHESEIRTYDKDEIVEKNVYLYIEPTGLHDMEAVTSIPCKDKISFTGFSRRVNSNKASTYCKMLEKEKRYLFDVSGSSIFSEQIIPIYEFKNVFQTNHGLLYGYDRIYVGPSKIATEYWSDSGISTLSPTIKVKKAYVAPLPPSVVESPEKYLLYYLPKILLLRERYGNDGEFWCPNIKAFIQALYLFNWEHQSAKMPVLSQTDNEVAFMEEVYAFLPNDILDVSKEEMEVLRGFLKPSLDILEECLVVFMDDEYIGRDFVKELETIYESVKVIYPTTEISRKVAILQKATTAILYCNKDTLWAWGFIWAMPSGSKLISIQSEMDLNGEIHHIASACGLHHNIQLVPKGFLAPITRKRILENISNKVATNSDLPVIYVPNEKEGFFNHKGDSFREMIDLWVEKGYVRKEYSTNKNVWMNGVGNILLYDRPNYDWIKNAGIQEQSWKKALFGNPKPIGPNSKSWTFWPRRPRLVEAMLSNKIEKTKEIVFYGKIENQIQKNNRIKYDWSSVCDANDFYLASESEPSKFSEQEYLDRLSQAKYGLCLAGYGKKCHREVECMAFGTVPLVAPEVDMDSYANKPVEGVHYIRVSSPEDLKYKLALMSDTVWKAMSEQCKKWYLENCSVDGMWKLTQQLVSQ